MEILRRFIQRVQAMKSPDHNGEDNFARDFMVSVRPSRRRRHPRVSVAGPPGAPLASPPSRPGPGLRQRFVCGARAQRPARSASLREARSPPPHRGLGSPRPGSRGSGRPAQPAPAPPPATPYCLPGRASVRAAAARVRARLPTPAVPACPSGEGRGEPSGRGRRSGELERGRCWRSLAESLCCCRPGSEGTVGRRRLRVHGDYHRLPKGWPYGISCST